MRKSLAVLLLAAFVADARAVTIAWSPVGNPGNAADTFVRQFGTSGYGAVGYAYNIGTNDVTTSQYVEFLNTKDPTGANTLGLYNTDMSNATLAEININPTANDGNKYSVIPGDENFPVVHVTWFDAIRFANWLNNGQGTHDTESGAYILQGGTPTPSNANSISRQVGATVVLPSENEWYKAAYYDPRTTAQGGPPSDSHYWQYPTSSNTNPTASVPTGAINSANYNNAVGHLTDVGAYAQSVSPYGTYDQGGNVYQWTETAFDATLRVHLGGGLNSTGISRFGRNGLPPTGEGFDGFRLANIPTGYIPEPSSLALAGLGFAALAALGWRKPRPV